MDCSAYLTSNGVVLRTPPFVPFSSPLLLTHGTSLRPFRTIVGQFRNGSGLRQAGTRLRPAFPRPRFPPPRAVADAVVSDDRQQRVDQRRTFLRPRRFD